MIAIAVSIHLANAMELLTLGSLLSLAMIYYRTYNFWKLLLRVRWLLITLILIFSFNIPGEYVRSWPFEFAPTYEGLTAGIMQSAKICVMLAGLALVLGSTNRENLITGFYQLLAPLRILNLDTERFAARLWLTLHYVEEAPRNKRSVNGAPISVFEHLSVAFPKDNAEYDGPENISLKIQKLNGRDWLVVAVLIGAGIYLLCV